MPKNFALSLDSSPSCSYQNNVESSVVKTIAERSGWRLPSSPHYSAEPTDSRAADATRLFPIKIFEMGLFDSYFN